MLFGAEDRLREETEQAPEDTDAPKTVAVVDVGSTAIRMVVAEIQPDGDWVRLDRASKPVSLGRDVFVTGFISRESMRQAIKILGGFCELLRGWQLSPGDVRVIATTAIREAKNRDTFVDRVNVRTGLEINIVEGVEENQLTYLAVQHAVNNMRGQFARSSSLIIEVGGGTTEVMLLHRGRMVAAHSLRLGTVRIEQQLQPGWKPGYQIEEYLKENVRVTQELLDGELALDRIKYFVAVGGDARRAAATVGRKVGDEYSVIEKADFDRFVARIQDLSVDECVRELGVTYNEAEGLVPALLIYKLFLDATSAPNLIVPDVSIREGVLVSFALGKDKAIEKEFSKQIIASARNLGRKFHYDEDHSLHVTKLALSFFDQFTDEHGLGEHARLLLEVAGILHDIGSYIRASGHHKHGQYIVENSELFGLSVDDIRIVGNVIRYHRKSLPTAAHTDYVSLRREQRMAVVKLAAMLRVADALDRGHSQRIDDITLERSEDDLIIHCHHAGDISNERYGIDMKADMFEEVFGYRIVIA